MNGRWDDAANWSPAALPDSTDQLFFGNAGQTGNYMIQLPDHTVTVNSLAIAPSAGNTIELVLPASNLSSPALTITAGGEALIVAAGGIFRNASGLTSGQSLLLRGGMRIENGGTYIHQSRSGHAADIVAKLTVAPGTETGRFEFDVPGGSYPVSLSNRVYGTLVFSSQASGGTQTYNASGTSPLQVRGDLRLQDGVTLNLDFTRDINIGGNLQQEAAVFNLASGPNRNTVVVAGDVVQASGGLITETSTGVPVLELRGAARQRADLRGAVQNQVVLRINNPSGVLLQHELAVPYELDLQQGNITSSRQAPLVIPHNSRITGASPAAFVQGPVKKLGDEAFLFPVGKQRDYAPLLVSAGAAVTEELTAEYFLGNPQTVCGKAMDAAAMVRVSALEYWRIDQSAGPSARKVTLSVSAYSQATALDKLLVSRWDEGAALWASAGNTAYTGVTTGQVTSSPVTRYGVFTLASTVGEQNPLPVRLVNLAISCDPSGCRLAWEVTGNFTGSFQVEQSSPAGFVPVASVPALPGVRHYAYPVPATTGGSYRIKCRSEGEAVDSSGVIAAAVEGGALRVLQVKRTGGEVSVTIRSGRRQVLQAALLTLSGRQLYSGRPRVEAGENRVRFPCTGADGSVVICILDDKGNRQAAAWQLR